MASPMAAWLPAPMLASLALALGRAPIAFAGVSGLVCLRGRIVP